MMIMMKREMVVAVVAQMLAVIITNDWDFITLESLGEDVNLEMHQYSILAENDIFIENVEFTIKKGFKMKKKIKTREIAYNKQFTN